MAECVNTEFRDVKPPEPLKQKPWMLKKKYYHYQKSNGHDTNKCNALNNDIKEHIQKGKLNQYVKKEEECKNSRSPRKGKSVANELRNPSKHDDSDSAFGDDRQKSRGRPVAMVIFGGYPIWKPEKVERR